MKKAVAKKPAAKKKAPARKVVAKKAAVARKTVKSVIKKIVKAVTLAKKVIKTPAKKAPAKKTPSKKAVAKKAVAKKIVAKKGVTKKIVAKKAVAKKAVAKKVVAKKAVARKPVSRTPVSKQAVARKLVTKAVAGKAKVAVIPKPVVKTPAIAKPKAVAKPKPVVKLKPVAKPKAPEADAVHAPLLSGTTTVVHEEGTPLVESLTDKLPEAPPKLRRTKPKKPADDGPVTVLSTVLAQLDDAKAEQIVTIGLDDKSAIADTMVVASGRSARHVGAIADQIVEKLKEAGFRDLRIEGMPQCDWVLVDAGDVVVHVFRPEVRSFYNLEKLWSAHAPNERLPI